MIRVRRGPAPDSLDGPDSSGGRETQRAVDKYVALRNSGGDTSTFKYTFRIYSEKDVKAALNELFHLKCAYCESRFGGTQPMDVEHFRPKGMVLETDNNGQERELKPGYYWLAAGWENLLPSCIDCNRERWQEIQGQDDPEKQGKANHFPLAAGSNHQREHDQAADETPLLLNPCDETVDPDTHLSYTEEAVVRAREVDGASSPMAEASIRVYGLNRAGLVHDRQQIAQLIRRKAETIWTLLDILEGNHGDCPVHILEDLMQQEWDSLLEFMRPERAYSAMARQIITDYFEVPDE